MASLFVGLLVIRLDAQGLYYDEVHQAPAAFAWVGRTPPFFSLMKVHGIPLLNLTYSCAFKSAIYGLWLRVSGQPFSIISWRMTGILLGAAGVAVLASSGGRLLAQAPRLLLGILLVSDASLLLMCRIDWGPVALGFLFRAVFIGSWLAAETPGAGRRYPLLMGIAAGLAMSEKLSSVVLIAPCVVMVLSSPRLRNRQCIASVLAGLSVGLLPLALVNALSFIEHRSLISLSDVQRVPRSLSRLMRHAQDYTSLGAGAKPMNWVLGREIPGRIVLIRALALGAAMIGIVVKGTRSRQPLGRMAAVSAWSWFMTGFFLWLLPRPTEAHHWIIGTPFQYVALALAAAAWLTGNSRSGEGDNRLLAGQTFRLLLGASLVVLTGTGILSTLSLAHEFAAGTRNSRFSADLTTIGERASLEGPEITFLAADWGVATQIYCLSNGRDGVVHELFWDYRDIESLVDTLGRSRVKAFYVVRLNPPSPVAGGAAARIFADASALPEWREVAIDKDLAGLRDVYLARFVKNQP